MYLLNKFENKYIIEGTLVAKSAIHIGTGNSDFAPTATDNPVIRDANNNPFIPGTSLKGVLRSFMERLLAAGIFEEFHSCNIVVDKEQEYCICNEDIKNIKNDPENYLKDNNRKYDDIDFTNKDEAIAKIIYREQCDVCKLFGGHGFSSKIKIADSKLISRAIIQTRDGVAIDRDTLTAADGKKYDFECVEPGASFSFNMTVDNLEDKYKELLKIIISILENGELYIGGKTSAGLGNICLEDVKIYKLDNKEKLKKYLLGQVDKDSFKEDL